MTVNITLKVGTTLDAEVESSEDVVRLARLTELVRQQGALTA